MTQFSQKYGKREGKIVNEKRISSELENERRLRREARLIAEEKERLRPKDKYDLAVAVAVNKGLKIQAENEKRRTKERRYQKNYETRKKEQYKSKSSRGSNPVYAISVNKVINDLKSVYSKKYPDSYSTQKMLIDNNISSYKELCRERVNNISVKILKKRINKYYPNFLSDNSRKFNF